MHECGRVVAATMMAAVMLALLLLGGCVAPTAMRANDLAALLQRLPGQYVDVAYGHAQAAAAGAGPAQELVIQRIDAALVGDNVFYVRFAVAGDTRRVLSQRIWSFQVDRDNRVVQAVYRFVEPVRWRQVERSPQLFESLLTSDLAPLAGCELIWHRDGAGYKGEAGDRCGAGTGARGLLVEQRISVTGDAVAGDELAIEQRQAGAVPAAVLEHFRRRAPTHRSGPDAQAGP